eukprot:TRINITY_DN2556_c0_g1_i1.p1 TRINITY_DN2556_c0_g1~~TRINITY_DN2556_c0_g1_i1.p1  ORF type:complete len:353 (-),score=98.93 TRINITY_DN2556_c0_g1_i1:153-1124(-)
MCIRDRYQRRVHGEANYSKKMMQAAMILRRTGGYSLRRSFASRKDYYEILGVSADASVDDIKDAYRNLAKKYHPDVNTTGETHEPSDEKFKDVAEAYAVLSVRESRLAYDLQNQRAPEHVFREKRMEAYRKATERGDNGQIKRDPYPRGTYAEQKQKILAEERKRFNVDFLGRYKGGVPKKGWGEVRGNAIGNPSEFHDPLMHNYLTNPHPDSQFVTSDDALAFKHYMNEDKFEIDQRWTWFQAKVDYEYFKFNRLRRAFRWLRNIILIAWGLPYITDLVLRLRNKNILEDTKTNIRENGVSSKLKVNHVDVRVSPSGVIYLA